MVAAAAVVAAIPLTVEVRFVRLCLNNEKHNFQFKSRAVIYIYGRFPFDRIG